MKRGKKPSKKPRKKQPPPPPAAVSKTPAEQAIRPGTKPAATPASTPAAAAAPGAGKGGVIPPKKHRWQKGKSGNPAGRPKNIGTTLKEYLNLLGDQVESEADLRRIARDPSEHWPKRAAAERALRMLEAGDIADFDAFLRGHEELEDLQKRGVNTEVIKKLRQTSRKVPTGKKDEVEEIIQREIELHDRAGADFDRVCDRTDGRPRQVIEAHIDDSIRTIPEAEDQAAALLDRIRRRFSAKRK